MIALIFAIILIAVILAWRGYQDRAQYCFAITLISSIGWFLQQATQHIMLQL